MKKIYIFILLLAVVLSYAQVSPVYVALPSSIYNVPAVENVTFTARLMSDGSNYVDCASLTGDSPSCRYFVSSNGLFGIIKIECGNFQTDLASEDIFNIGFSPTITYSLHSPTLELSWDIDEGIRSEDTIEDTIYLELDGGIQSFGMNENGEWEDDILPVTLSSFTANFNDGVPILQWITASENSNAGWNIYRSQEDAIENSYQVNSELISGQGTTTEETSYIFEDEYEIEYNTKYYYWLESVAYNGGNETYGSIALQIPENGNNNSPEIPIIYGLQSNYPNPFNPNTSLSFILKDPSDVSLNIYNIKGQKVLSLLNGYIDKVDEVITVNWEGKDQNGKYASSGIYFYQLITSDNNQIKKMTLIK